MVNIIICDYPYDPIIADVAAHVGVSYELAYEVVHGYADEEEVDIELRTKILDYYDILSEYYANL